MHSPRKSCACAAHREIKPRVEGARDDEGTFRRLPERRRISICIDVPGDSLQTFPPHIPRRVNKMAFYRIENGSSNVKARRTSIGMFGEHFCRSLIEIDLPERCFKCNKL